MITSALCSFLTSVNTSRQLPVTIVNTSPIHERGTHSLAAFFDLGGGKMYLNLDRDRVETELGSTAEACHTHEPDEPRLGMIGGTFCFFR